VLADLGDVRLWYDVAGSALSPDGEDRPVLVSVHGGPGADHYGMRDRLAPLTEHMQVVFYDQRGHGRSDYCSEEHWNLDTWADDLRRLCEHLGIAHPVVLGSSFGGFVTLAYASRFPDHPAAVVLANTSYRDDPALTIEAFRRLGGDDAAAAALNDFQQMSKESSDLFEEVCLPLYGAAPGYAAALAHTRARSISTIDVNLHFFRHELATMDGLGMAGRITCPTLILAGEDDPVCIFSVVQEFAAALPAATTRFVPLPGARHAIFADRPDLTYPEVIEFVRRHGTAAGPSPDSAARRS
jgi:proline iminopeptidase